MAVFLLAAAFKVTSLFSLMAISGIYLIELFRFKKLNETKKLIHSACPADSFNYLNIFNNRTLATLCT